MGKIHSHSIVRLAFFSDSQLETRFNFFRELRVLCKKNKAFLKSVKSYTRNAIQICFRVAKRFWVNKDAYECNFVNRECVNACVWMCLLFLYFTCIFFSSLLVSRKKWKTLFPYIRKNVLTVKEISVSFQFLDSF